MAGGADVVWLAGSRARGDAGPYSDIDLGVLAESPKQRTFRMYEGELTSVVWTTEAATRASFKDPAQVGGAVPGWRGARLLHDASGIGGTLRQEAAAWTWDAIAAACDRWVARDLTQMSEEVRKLLNALDADDDRVTAERCNVLAGRLPLTLSIHHRILYDSERYLSRLVGEEMGPDWARQYDVALGLGGESPPLRAAGALALFELATADCARVLSADERDVAAHTVERHSVEPHLMLDRIDAGEHGGGVAAGADAGLFDALALREVPRERGGEGVAGAVLADDGRATRSAAAKRGRAGGSLDRAAVCAVGHDEALRAAARSRRERTARAGRATLPTTTSAWTPDGVERRACGGR